VRALEIGLSTITVLAVAVGIQAVGVVLMAAMLITPAAAARYWTDDLRKMVFLAALFGALSGIVGAYVSYDADNMPTGPWIVVALSLIAFLSMFFAPGRGMWAKYQLQRNNRLKMLEENILKIFYHLGEKSDNFTTYQKIQDLESKRKIPRPSLKKGLKRLIAKQLLTHTEQGYRLNEAGIKAAKRVVRLHRLWEVYLTQYLRIAPDHVHDTAEAVEHIITPELEIELEKLLQFPSTDPHGSVIPSKS
jgi:manganese/zinc/iron transport system permease protein